MFPFIDCYQRDPVEPAMLVRPENPREMARKAYPNRLPADPVKSPGPSRDVNHRIEVLSPKCNGAVAPNRITRLHADDL
jgi:hypothetical protein